jgi:hypothetical protein
MAKIIMLNVIGIIIVCAIVILVMKATADWKAVLMALIFGIGLMVAMNTVLRIY